MSKTLKATHYGVLPIGDIKLTVAVLEDKTRVISERSLATAFGSRGSGAYWQKRKTLNKEDILPEYISANYLAPFVSEALKETLSKSIQYETKTGSNANGYPATVLPDICDVWIKAKNSKALNKSQIKIAEQAYILLKGFAGVGIIALVDEATGYQEVREKDALLQFLEKFLQEEQGKWVKTFDDEFFETIFKMKGWNWIIANKGKKPPVVGHYINNFVYSRLAPNVLKELRRLNPVTEKGHRKYKHPQFIKPDFGHPLLKQHIAALIALGKASGYNWKNFQRLVERAFPKFGEVREIPYPDDTPIY